MASRGYLRLLLQLGVIYTISASTELIGDVETNIATDGTLRTQNQHNLSRRADFSLNAAELNNGNALPGPLTPPIPTSLEVRSDSVLTPQSGQQAEINFEVTNNRNTPILYTFTARVNEGGPVQPAVQPQRSYITPRSTMIVRVLLPPEGLDTTSGTSSSLITFSALWQLPDFREESVSKKVYLRRNYKSSDSSKPTISYTYNGNCGSYLDPMSCKDKTWRADITVQDSDSGLLMIKSYPVGLILNKEFIVGTTEELNGYYRVSCCQTKVDVTATDLYGNEKSLYIDIEKIWLSTGEITAIVLGSILLLILIVLLVLCIIRLCRRRSSLSIYPDSRPL